MTEERLYEILKEHGGHESQAWVLAAMKKAVNEAIQECADTVDKYEPYLYQNGGINILLNLKVK